MKIKKHLHFGSLVSILSKHFRAIPDWRRPPKKKKNKLIPIKDALMSGFACMYFQDPSLLQFQKRMQEDQHRNNLNTLLGVRTIPKETQMRTIIDGVDSDCFKGPFKEITQRLQRGKQLERFQLFPKQYYIPMDASQFYASEKIHCEHCLVKNRSKGTQYSHQILQGGIAHPDCSQVIPLMPEQIVNSDGSTKQDCEMNAAKRWIKKLRSDFPKLGMILGGDALFSKQPIIEEAKKLNISYIFMAKPGDHKYMMKWLDDYDNFNRVEFIDDKGRRHCYEWINRVPLNGRDDTVKVNYFRCRIYTVNIKNEEKTVYQGSWVTDIEIDENTIETLVKAGRCRWKNENEIFNVMKNHGYYMERNYGHGKKHLAFNFYLLTLLAFTFHQIFELTDKQYQACRKKFGSKRHLWEKLRAYIDVLIFENWESLLAFALASKVGLLKWSTAPPS